MRDRSAPDPLPVLRLGEYLRATRHAFSSLVFVLPLLVVYEVGVMVLSGEQNPSLRNGADAYLRWVLSGWRVAWIAPLIVVATLAVGTSFTWSSRPKCPWSVWLGMWLESFLFAVLLWGLSRWFGPLLDALGLPLNLPIADRSASQVITYLGAGIYEEFLFRLLGFAGSLVFLRIARIELWLAVPVALLGSSVVFAGAHHIGPNGQAFDTFVFLFRTVIGVLCALLYWLRGFGVAVGTHALYDILVGVSVG